VDRVAKVIAFLSKSKSRFHVSHYSASVVLPRYEEEDK
jgi:hypothetical protein